MSKELWLEADGQRRACGCPLLGRGALTRGFALHPGTRNRYEIRDTRTQHRPSGVGASTRKAS